MGTFCVTAGKDLQAQKATFPSFWGISESQNKANRLIEAAKAELIAFGEKAQPLIAIADFIVDRRH